MGVLLMLLVVVWCEVVVVFGLYLICVVFCLGKSDLILVGVLLERFSWCISLLCLMMIVLIVMFIFWCSFLIGFGLFGLDVVRIRWFLWWFSGNRCSWVKCLLVDSMVGMVLSLYWVRFSSGIWYLLVINMVRLCVFMILLFISLLISCVCFLCVFCLSWVSSVGVICLFCVRVSLSVMSLVC